MASSETWFLCSCDKRLESTDDVDAHDKSWLALGHDKQCRYPGCTIISPQTSNAKRHWRTHLPDRLGKYFCSKCDASYVKPEALEKHQAAVVCRKNRKRCRSTFEHDTAPLSPSTVRQADTPLLDLQGNKWFPLHPEAAVRHNHRKRHWTVFGEFPPSISTPWNDMSSTSGDASESENPLQTPSRETSPPSTTDAPSPTMGVPHSTEIYPDNSPPLPAQGAWEPPQIGTQVGPTDKRSKARVQEEIDLVMSLQREADKAILSAYEDTDQPTIFQGHLPMPFAGFVMDNRMPSPFRPHVRDDSTPFSHGEDSESSSATHRLPYGKALDEYREMKYGKFR